MDQNEYVEELKLLQEKRESENEIARHALELEKQKTKTEKAKQGTGKTAVRLAGITVFGVAFMIAITWLIVLFLPDNAEKAFEIVKNLFN